MKLSIQLIFCCFVLLFSCNKSVKKEYLKSTVVRPSTYEQNNQATRNQLNYIPDLEHLDHTPIKYIRVNFHVMCNGEGKANFDRERGRKHVRMIYERANQKLGNNKKMNLPPGNDTPLVPIRYRYQLTGMPNDPNDDGIYFHNDEELYGFVGSGKNRNNYDKDIFEKYGVQKDTVLNIFIMTHHLDSLASKTYKKDSKGIGFPNFVKVTHWFESVKNTTWKEGDADFNFGKWVSIKLLNHEIGHSIGLRHTWRGNDGCDDTPKHTNCWNRTKGQAPCDEWWSNNFMDYNVHSSAWSPCQIGTVHRNFSNQHSAVRKLLVPVWCELDEKKTIHIKKDFEWLGAKDLEGHLVIEDNATLTVRSRLSLPKGGKIIIHPGGKLILDAATLENNCGDTWKGIEIWSKKNLKGTVEIYNNSKILNAEKEVSFTEVEP